jgi:outer membrane immunogenic protein
LFASCGVTYAADLGVPVKAAPAMAPAWTWTGFYVGANVGGGWADVDATVRFLGLTGAVSDHIEGIVGGAQVGYNWQLGNFVVGVETDIQASDQKATLNGFLFGIPFSEVNKVGYFGTVRGRLGVAIDRWLAYVTGGYAYGDFSYVNTNPLGTFRATHNDAWVIGGGIEVMLAGPWSAKLEYLYLDTGNFTRTFGTFLGPAQVTSRTKDNIVRLGVNYRF